MEILATETINYVNDGWEIVVAALTVIAIASFVITLFALLDNELPIAGMFTVILALSGFGAYFAYQSGLEPTIAHIINVEDLPQAIEEGYEVTDQQGSLVTIEKPKGADE